MTLFFNRDYPIEQLLELRRSHPNEFKRMVEIDNMFEVFVGLRNAYFMELLIQDSPNNFKNFGCNLSNHIEIIEILKEEMEQILHGKRKCFSRRFDVPNFNLLLATLGGLKLLVDGGLREKFNPFPEGDQRKQNILSEHKLRFIGFIASILPVQKAFDIFESELTLKDWKDSTPFVFMNVFLTQEGRLYFEDVDLEPKKYFGENILANPVASVFFENFSVFAGEGDIRPEEGRVFKTRMRIKNVMSIRPTVETGYSGLIVLTLQLQPVFVRDVSEFIEAGFIEGKNLTVHPLRTIVKEDNKPVLGEVEFRHFFLAPTLVLFDSLKSNIEFNIFSLPLDLSKTNLEEKEETTGETLGIPLHPEKNPDLKEGEDSAKGEKLNYQRFPILFGRDIQMTVNGGYLISPTSLSL